MTPQDQLTAAAKSAADELVYDAWHHLGEQAQISYVGKIITKHMQPLVQRLEQAEKTIEGVQQNTPACGACASMLWTGGTWPESSVHTCAIAERDFLLAKVKDYEQQLAETLRYIATEVRKLAMKEKSE